VAGEPLRNPTLPLVSAVIPTRNRARLLGDCVASLRAQDYPRDRFEIIVVDDGSTDETPAVVRRFLDQGSPSIRYLRQDHRGANAARNAGIATAKGDPICLVDDDVEAPPGWLRELVSGALRHPEAGAVGGPIRVRFEGKAPRFCGREALAGEAELNLGTEERAVREVNGTNMAIRRWALQAVGGFDPALPLYGDELEWERRLLRAGHFIFYIPSAPLWHRRTQADLGLLKLVKRYHRRGMGHLAFARRTGEEVAVRSVLWWLFSSLAHAVRRRCTMGILMTAQQVGTLWGLLQERYRRPDHGGR
jgi:glycosyltransferase involved in cell wall biosynthesis